MFGNVELNVSIFPLTLHEGEHVIVPDVLNEVASVRVMYEEDDVGVKVTVSEIGVSRMVELKLVTRLLIVEGRLVVTVADELVE